MARSQSGPDRPAADRLWHHTDEGFRNPPGSPAPGGDFGDWRSFFWRRFASRGHGRTAGGPRPAAGRGAGGAWSTGAAIMTA